MTGHVDLTPNAPGVPPVRTKNSQILRRGGPSKTSFEGVVVLTKTHIGADMVRWVCCAAAAIREHAATPGEELVRWAAEPIRSSGARPGAGASGARLARWCGKIPV